jgi:lysyl-tRNA synthetase class 2
MSLWLRERVILSWKPSASINTLISRAQLIQNIRQFFISRDVLEVETPTLSCATVTDVHLQGFQTHFISPFKADSQLLYMQTSPEFAMKRLLSAGSGAIFQICKAFRNEEAGRYHNPEFTMLEWYRHGFDHFQLMEEVDELMQSILRSQPADTISYQNVFLQYLKFDPLNANLALIKKVCIQHGFTDIAELETNKDTLLQLLFSHVIEPGIGQLTPVFVTDFPASQAALARISRKDNRVAERFELYFKGIELANGFHELTDPKEQRRRFTLDNQVRADNKLPVMPVDELLLRAMDAGLPQCSGVALGIDRLMMLALQKQDISEVIAFSINNA